MLAHAHGVQKAVLDPGAAIEEVESHSAMSTELNSRFLEEQCGFLMSEASFSPLRIFFLVKGFDLS